MTLHIVHPTIASIVQPSLCLICQISSNQMCGPNVNCPSSITYCVHKYNWSICCVSYGNVVKLSMAHLLQTMVYTRCARIVCVNWRWLSMRIHWYWVSWSMSPLHSTPWLMLRLHCAIGMPNDETSRCKCIDVDHSHVQLQKNGCTNFFFAHYPQ